MVKTPMRLNTAEKYRTKKKKSLINYCLLQDNMSRQEDSASFYALILGIAFPGPETHGLRLPAPAIRIHEGRCQGLAW